MYMWIAKDWEGRRQKLTGIAVYVLPKRETVFCFKSGMILFWLCVVLYMKHTVPQIRYFDVPVHQHAQSQTHPLPPYMCYVRTVHVHVHLCPYIHLLAGYVVMWTSLAGICTGMWSYQCDPQASEANQTVPICQCKWMKNGKHAYPVHAYRWGKTIGYGLYRYH